MSNKLVHLVKMQKIDDEISQNEDKKKILPNRLKELRDGVTTAKQAVDIIAAQITDNHLKQQEKEKTIKTNNEQVLKYEHMLESIKTNKEYKALNSEISFMKSSNSDIELELISIMEEESKIKEMISIEKAKETEAQKRLKENEDKLQLEIIAVDHQIEALKEQRNQVAKLLPVTLVKRYISLIKAKNRKAVTYILNNACSGCGFHIRPQLLIELSQPDKIVNCENCGRILVKSFDIE